MLVHVMMRLTFMCKDSSCALIRALITASRAGGTDNGIMGRGGGGR